MSSIGKDQLFIMSKLPQFCRLREFLFVHFFSILNIYYFSQTFCHFDWAQRLRNLDSFSVFSMRRFAPYSKWRFPSVLVTTRLAKTKSRQDGNRELCVPYLLDASLCSLLEVTIFHVSSSLSTLVDDCPPCQDEVEAGKESRTSRFFSILISQYLFKQHHLADLGEFASLEFVYVKSAWKITSVKFYFISSGLFLFVY